MVASESKAHIYLSLNYRTLSPTLSPTLTPFINFDPTLSPTLGPSLSPTFSPTLFPTLSPTLARRKKKKRALERTSTVDNDALVPIEVDILDKSVGANYTLLILSNRTAAVTGYIQGTEDYQGHFACGCQEKIGVNSIIQIVEVIDSNGGARAAPEWNKVVAGVESSEGSGRMHSIFIGVDGDIYAAGNNNMGQLCLGDKDSRIFPTQIDLPDNERAVDAVVGGEFTLILTNSGMVYGCGSNKSGQLCTEGDSVPLPTAMDFVNAPNTAVTSFKADRESSYISFDDGSVTTCGLNDVGHLDDGTKGDTASER